MCVCVGGDSDFQAASMLVQGVGGVEGSHVKKAPGSAVFPSSVPPPTDGVSPISPPTCHYSG